jgi:copper transport protein
MVSVLAQAVPAALANPTPPVWRVLSKAGYFVGLMGVIGGCLLHLLVLRPVLSRPSVDAVDRAVLERRLALFLAGVGVYFVVALYFQFAGLIARAKGSGNTHISYGHALSPAAIWGYITKPGAPSEWISTGAMAGVQYGLWVLAAIVLMLLWVPRIRAHLTSIVWTALAITLVSHQLSLLPTKSFSVDALVDVVANHVHVIAICTWIGGIAGLVVLALARGALTERSGAVWAQVWSRFSTVALVAVGCVVTSGLYMAWTLIGSPAELFTTKFGNVLLVKVSLVAVIVLIGASHEFILMPRMARARAAGDRASLFALALRVAPGMAAAELAFGAAALLAMTFLNGSARTQAGDADPTLSGNVIGLGVLLIVVLGATFAITGKLSERLAAPPERLAAAGAKRS